MTDKEGYVQVIDREEFVGVYYRIRNTEVVERDGKHFLKFDYDVKNLNEADEKEFEHYLGELLIRALEWSVEQDKLNDGNPV
jgi:hypothetical protein